LNGALRAAPWVANALPSQPPSVVTVDADGLQRSRELLPNGNLKPELTPQPPAGVTVTLGEISFEAVRKWLATLPEGPIRERETARLFPRATPGPDARVKTSRPCCLRLGCQL